MSDHEQILSRLLNQIAAERALAHPQIEIRPITSGGANFTTQLFQATISDGDTDLNLFAKVAAIGEKFRAQLPTQMFDSENDFYTKLNKIYERLQEKHNVPKELQFAPPTCYGCSGKLYEEVVVLEDLSVQGFTVYDRLKSVDWEYASKAIEEIAKFHALSIAFEKENKAEFDKYVDSIKFSWDVNNDKYIIDLIAKGVSVVKEENRSRLEKFLVTFEAKDMEAMFSPVKINVLAHGDNRVSNHLYRVNADGEVEIKIVDYQTLRGASPAVDLLYFIFSGTDEKFRAQYYDQLLDHYYKHLSLTMRSLGLDPDVIFSREDFDFEYKSKLPFGMTLALVTLPIVTVDAESAPKVDQEMNMGSLMLDTTNDLFKERINGIVNDFIKWGLL